MGLEVGGYHDRPDWPKMGPSLLIATCLILAIRTAKWAARSDAALSEVDLDQEIDHVAHLPSRVLAKLVSRHPGIFPSLKDRGTRRTTRTWEVHQIRFACISVVDALPGGAKKSNALICRFQSLRNSPSFSDFKNGISPRFGVAPSLTRRQSLSMRG